MVNNNAAVRYLIYLCNADDSSDCYLYRVIDVIVPGVVTQGVCDVEAAKCLLAVYSDAVSNFRIDDNRIVLGWSDEALKAMEELNRSLPSVFTIVGADKDAAERLPVDGTDEDEFYDERFENWELPEDTPGIGQPGFHWGM